MIATTATTQLVRVEDPRGEGRVDWVHVGTFLGRSAALRTAKHTFAVRYGVDHRVLRARVAAGR